MSRGNWKLGSDGQSTGIPMSLTSTNIFKNTNIHRVFLVILAGFVTNRCHALLIVQPQTLLKCHRAGFKLFWIFKSKARGRKPKISKETILHLKKMASENRLWGAERIQGELLKHNIRVSKRTIQKYMRQVKPSRSASQTWSTFLKNHSHRIWTCDFVSVTDIYFRQIYFLKL